MKAKFFILTTMLITLNCKYEKKFCFVVIADPHVETINSVESNSIRLEKAVEYINKVSARKNIKFLFVVGDIAWGNDNIDKSKKILDKSIIPYFPMIGDNEIVTGSEKYFHDTYRALYDKHRNDLSGTLGPAKVHYPSQDKDVYLNNFSFEYSGVNFIIADWNSRDIDDDDKENKNEDADLNDFPDGTFEWFKNCVLNAKKSIAIDEQTELSLRNNILVFSHHPMANLACEPLSLIENIPSFKKFSPFTLEEATTRYLFNENEYKNLTDFTRKYTKYLAVNYCGHIHFKYAFKRHTDGLNLFEGLHPIAVTSLKIRKAPRILIVEVSAGKNKSGELVFHYDNQYVDLE